MASEENAGDCPPAITMLRSKLKNLTKKVDGLLKQRNLDAPDAEPVVDRAGVEDRGKKPEEEGSSSDSESSDEENEEEMVDLFVNSLRAHASSRRTKAIQQKQASSEADLNVSWMPDTGLPSSTELVTTKLQRLINNPEKNLEDGLFVPTINIRKLNKIAKKNIPDTAGSKWFNMPAQTLTPELKRELQLVKLRGALDPKRHYKKEDSKKLPKYFQIGTVVEGPGEFYSSRLTKAQRKSTIAEELLADAGVQDFRKRKFTEIMERNSAGRNRKQKKVFKKRK